MSNINTTALPEWQADRLAVLRCPRRRPITDAERRHLAWLRGFDAHTVEAIAP